MSELSTEFFVLILRVFYPFTRQRVFKKLLVDSVEQASIERFLFERELDAISVERV